MIFDAPNINRFWADLIVEELVRNGVDFFCVAPGSRSTPLVTAVAAHPRARTVMHFDERGTAFCALGYARATRTPAVWITTSGTALANGFPAIIEAATDGVPMLLLTADRPPELRQTGANQTINQVKLFGEQVRWFFDLPSPTLEVNPAMVLTTMDQAIYRARRGSGGPVHINCMFREPLAPTEDGWDVSRYALALSRWHESDTPYTQYAPGGSSLGPDERGRIAGLLQGKKQGLVVAGRLASRGEGEAALRLATALGWPLLPDVSSQVRLGAASDVHIAYYDQLLGNTSFCEAHRPDVVLHIGGRATSKRLAQFIEKSHPKAYIVVNSDPNRLDPDHQVTLRLVCDETAFCEGMAAFLEGATEASPWLIDWRKADRHTAEMLAPFFAEAEQLSEPWVACFLSRHLRAGHGFVVASSMPVRDVDMFADPNGAPVRVGANRGASGIDGLIATAAGFSDGLQQPVTLLIGDLASLYDLNSMALLRTRPVVVIVLNNDGGGIFHFLPIANHADVFEPFFGTPHGITFEAAARLFNLEYHHPETPDAFAEAYRTASQCSSGTLIEVRTNRAENVRLHRRLLAKVAASQTLG